MATLAGAMLHEEIWLVRSAYFTPPNDMTMLRFQSGFWDHSFSPCYFFQRHFAQMLLCMGLVSAVHNLSSLNICDSAIHVLFLLFLQ